MYTKQEADSYINALNDDVAKRLPVVSPYEPSVNHYSFMNRPKITIPLSIRSSDKTEHLTQIHDHSILFYKQIAFTPDCTFSGANAPYTALHVDSFVSQVNAAIDTQESIISSVTGDGVVLFFSQTQLSELTASTIISRGRMFNPGELDDGQLSLNATMDTISNN